jgi:hypothetical protein
VSLIADIPVDGNVRVVWMASAPANKAAPTVAELNAGLLLTSVLAADGLTGWQPETASIGNRKLDSTFNSQDVGTVSIDEPLFRFFKQTGTDTIYNTLTVFATGTVAIRRSLPSATGWATGQLLVGVYPSKCGYRKWLDVEENTMERWEVPIRITAQPAFDAVVA